MKKAFIIVSLAACLMLGFALGFGTGLFTAIEKDNKLIKEILFDSYREQIKNADADGEMAKWFIEEFEKPKYDKYPDILDCFYHLCFDKSLESCYLEHKSISSVSVDSQSDGAEMDRLRYGMDCKYGIYCKDEEGIEYLYGSDEGQMFFLSKEEASTFSKDKFDKNEDWEECGVITYER